MRLGALVLTVGLSHGLAWNCNKEEALEIRHAGMSRRYLIHSREVHCSGPGPFPLIFNLAPDQLTAEQQNFVTGDFSFGINGRNHGNQLGAKGNRFSDIMDIEFADQNFILITLEGATVKSRGGLSASKRKPAARDEVDLVRKILDRTRKSYNVGDVFAVGFREGATLAWHLACHMQLRAIAPVHGAPLPGPAFASCPFQPPPAVVFTGDHDPNDVATRSSLAYYQAQMRQNYPDRHFISKITFCKNTVTCETSSTRCGEGRVMLCYAKSPTSAHNCALESSHRNSSGRHNPCCLDSSTCDVAYAEACSACASYEIWAGANCDVATSDSNKSCLGTSAPDVHTTIFVLDFFADYVRLDQQSSSTMLPSSQQLWNSKQVLQKLRSGFASWGLLVSAWMGQRCYPGPQYVEPTTVLRMDLPLVTLKNFGIIYQPLPDPDAPRVRCFYPTSLDYNDHGSPCSAPESQCDLARSEEKPSAIMTPAFRSSNRSRHFRQGRGCYFSDVELGINFQKQTLKTAAEGDFTHVHNRAIISRLDRSINKELLGFYWAHPASVSIFQSDDNQTLCCDIPMEWKDYIRHRWLPIVDLTTAEPWEALDFARGGKPFAETAIKLVSDQNYQRIINQCARTIVEDSELCLGCSS